MKHKDNMKFIADCLCPVAELDWIFSTRLPAKLLRDRKGSRFLDRKAPSMVHQPAVPTCSTTKMDASFPDRRAAARRTEQWNRSGFMFHPVSNVPFAVRNAGLAEPHPAA
ncbi:hypothetical protein ABMY26_02555 [Azospirillum sp. HJ39]|uniref:hypothetical protein n=1 Tax=Azospirillum sp. HJ39 TaxID=3159496 RepID=UPI0035568704